MNNPPPFRPVKVVTNAFIIAKLPTHAYTQYDVFQPEMRGKMIRKKNELMVHLQSVAYPDVFQPYFFYDGGAVGYAHPITAARLGGARRFQVNLRVPGPPSKDAKGSVEITFTQTNGGTMHPTEINRVINQAEDSPQREIITNFLQLVVRQETNNKHANNGKAYFLDTEKESLQNGLELRRGIFHSVRPAIERMIVTVDTVAAAFYEAGPLIESVAKFLGVRNIRQLNTIPPKEFIMISKNYRKVLIVTKTSGERRKTINGFVQNGGGYAFDKDGEPTTVAEHYEKVYNIRLAYPSAPGVVLRDHPVHGKVVVPMELCKIIPGQLFKKKLSEKLTPRMVTFATLRPQERLNRISRAATGYQQSEYMRQAGMEVTPTPLQVDGKLLEVPPVTYKNGSTKPDGGKWNVVRKHFYSPAALKWWAVFSFCKFKFPLRDCERKVLELQRCCEALDSGRPITIKEVGDIRIGEIGPTLDGVLRECMEITQGALRDPAAQKAFMLLVILPDDAAEIRNAVKFWGDVKNGVTTQCLRLGKFKSSNNQYHNNVLLKINARLGGCNAHVDQAPVMKLLSSYPFMIVGADVGHPGPGVRKPSVTSLVFSYDKSATKYIALTRIQSPRVEIIQDLREMFRTALDTFGKKGSIPRNIIFYRDGVSEGEYQSVFDQEIAAINGAIDDIWQHHRVKAPKPNVTFIVVGKRHHSLLFPPTVNDTNVGDGKGNCKAGVVVDSGITQPFIKDFYLQSHSAIQGTSRSSHYVVLQNEVDVFTNKFQSLQELSFALCHVYAKATRSVSIPAPVYYADLVCSRGGFHIDPSVVSSLTFEDNSSVASNEDAFNLDHWQEVFRQVNGTLRERMYFL